MRRVSILTVLSVSISVSIAWADAQPATAVEAQVLKTIPFTVEVPGPVKEECALDTRVPGFIKSSGGDVVLVDKFSKSGRRLELSITEIHAPGGGIFTGPKWMTVVGKLHNGGKLEGSFRAKRFSGGGAFASFKGTCAIIGRAAKAIGQDIAGWLNAPSMNAELGDAR